jgi:hypothetical protein
MIALFRPNSESDKARRDGRRPPMCISSTPGETPRWSPKGADYYRYGPRFFWVSCTGSSTQPFGAPELVLVAGLLPQGSACDIAR